MNTHTQKHIASGTLLFVSGVFLVFFIIGSYSCQYIPMIQHDFHSICYQNPNGTGCQPLPADWNRPEPSCGFYLYSLNSTSAISVLIILTPMVIGLYILSSGKTREIILILGVSAAGILLTIYVMGGGSYIHTYRELIPPPCYDCAITGPVSPSVQITNIVTDPPVVHVGTSFWVRATVTNNSPNTLLYSGICSSPVSVSFDRNVVQTPVAQCQAIGPPSTLAPYKSVSIATLSNNNQAIATGVVNGHITFNYGIQTGNSTNQIPQPNVFTSQTTSVFSLIVQ